MKMATPMDTASCTGAVEREGALLARAATQAGPEAVVPTCPGWTVRDLVRHQGGVHRWATGIVATPRTEAWNLELDEVVGTWPDDDELLPWFRQGCADLVDALVAAPADLDCWVFLPASSPLAHWARRQAHETAVHRVDAELAAGVALSPLPAAFAADGADEVLTGFVPRRRRRLEAGLPAVVRFGCTDAPGSWTLQLTDESAAVTRDTEVGPTGDRPECIVTGAASDLYLALWSRPGVERLSVEGDPTALRSFLDWFHVR